MLISQFDKFVNRSTQEILGSEIERENLVPMLSTDIARSAGDVTGVKGEKEVYYRTGNVNLTSDDIGALNEDNVYNGLDQTNSGYALDARQGKALKETIDDKFDKANVYNALDKTVSGYALDARQGKVLADKLDATQSGLAIIVDADTASMAVPVGGYAYIKNNTHGLTEGLYTNTSSAAFSASGGIADGTVFTVVSGDGGALNAINNSITRYKNVSISFTDGSGSIQIPEAKTTDIIVVTRARTTAHALIFSGDCLTDGIVSVAAYNTSGNGTAQTGTITDICIICFHVV